MNSRIFKFKWGQSTGEDARAYIWQSGIVLHE
jgi:hypothetical protein